MIAESLRIVGIVLPVFLIMAVGYALRRRGILSTVADESLLGVLVKLFIPCLALDVIVGNPALLRPENLIWPPVAGFLSVAIGVGLAMLVAAFFLKGDAVKRTFSAAAGLQNYGYTALPLCQALFDREVTGVLFAYTLGVEVGMWTLVVVAISGRQASRRWWAQVLSPPIVAILAAVLLNLAGADAWIPVSVDTAWHMLGLCAVPLGLLVSGAMLADYVSPHLFARGWNVTTAALAVRILLAPLAILGLAATLPADPALKSVLVIQAAMPAAVFPIVLAKIHHGDMPTALRCVMATSIVGLVTIPLWISFGAAVFGLAVNR